MPLFFLLIGFFTAMLWRKRGLGGLLRQLAKRIALPLALGCVTIVPAMWGIVIWAGSGNTTYGAADTGKDIWTAAAYGNLEAVRGHFKRGVSIDGEEPIFGQSPLAWAVIGDRRNVVNYLLEAGADPDARYRDRNTALHTAAFFGRADAASLLLDAGAEIDARNIRDETPLGADPWSFCNLQKLCYTIFLELQRGVGVTGWVQATSDSPCSEGYIFGLDEMILACA